MRLCVCFQLWVLPCACAGAMVVCVRTGAQSTATSLYSSGGDGVIRVWDINTGVQASPVCV